MERNSSLLNDEIISLLEKQVEHETYNSILYRTFASWCDANGLKKSAEIFNNQFTEEQSHATALWEYLQNCGVFVQYPTIKGVDINEINNDAKSTFKLLFELSLEREISTTESLKKIASVALNDGDHITYLFLRDLLMNQITEEKEAHDRLDAFKHSSDNLVIDSYLE